MPHLSYRGSAAAAVFGCLVALAWIAGGCASPPAPSPGAEPAPEPPPAPEAPAAPERLPAPSRAAPPPDACVFAAGAPGADTVRVIADAGFAPRQLYQTLIRLDCSGLARPDIAEAWASADGGLSWTFSLGAASFWDGTPVTADAIKAGWQERAAAERLRQAGIILVSAVGERGLRLLFARPSDSVPDVLADPALAVVRRLSDSAWPVGTGPYRLPETDPAPTTLEPVGKGRPLRVLSRPRDLRDAIDAGADLIVTDDPSTLAYAARRADFTALALPWSRSYDLVLAAPADTIAVTAAGFRDALARDALRVDARAAQPAAPPPPCDPAPASAPARGARPAGRIAYPAGDPTARDLAARLAAVGVASAHAIVPLESAALRASLREGSEAGYVVGLPGTPALCEELTLPAGAALVPLVDVRAHALIRRGAPPITVDRDGIVRLLPEVP